MMSYIDMYMKSQFFLKKMLWPMELLNFVI